MGLDAEVAVEFISALSTSRMRFLLTAASPAHNEHHAHHACKKCLY